jgi:chromosome transmission fidelity protein 4
MYDSEGVLSVLDRFRRPGQSRWVPLLDTRTLARRQGKDESYWPVGVAGNNFTCLILKVSLL